MTTIAPEYQHLLTENTRLQQQVEQLTEANAVLVERNRALEWEREGVGPEVVTCG